MDDAKKPATEHLAELRWRLLLCLIPLICGAIVAAIYHQHLLKIVLSPLGQSVYFSSPMGGLQLIITLSLLSGAIVTIPFFLYQAIRFIEPALPRQTRARPFIIILASFCLLLLGITFAYRISLPAALSFLVSFETESIRSLISAREYFTFFAYYLLGFGLIFQLPLVMLLINAFYRLRPKRMLSALKYVLLISFIVAAILTPTPDPVNQLMMACPIIILYLASIVLIMGINRYRKLDPVPGNLIPE